MHIMAARVRTTVRHSGEGEVMWQHGFQEKVGLGKGPERREWIQEQKACSRW